MKTLVRVAAMLVWCGLMASAQKTAGALNVGLAAPALSFTAVPAAFATTTSVAAPAVALAAANKNVAPAAFTSVNTPIVNPVQTLPTIELSPIMQTYSVPSTTQMQENIKQPITQPIMQPYLQRYVQQAQPIVQPIVNRVVQPVIHRQLHPFLTSSTEQGPAAFTVTQPTQYTMTTNQVDASILIVVPVGKLCWVLTLGLGAGCDGE